MKSLDYAALSGAPHKTRVVAADGFQRVLVTFVAITEIRRWSTLVDASLKAKIGLTALNTLVMRIAALTKTHQLTSRLRWGEERTLKVQDKRPL